MDLFAEDMERQTLRDGYESLQRPSWSAVQRHKGRASSPNVPQGLALARGTVASPREVVGDAEEVPLVHANGNLERAPRSRQLWEPTGIGNDQLPTNT